MSSKEEEIKKEVREAYSDSPNKKMPKTKMYLAILVIMVLLGALYFMLYTPQGTSLLEQAGIKISAPANAAEANSVANDLGKSLDETSNVINDLSTSLGV